jgi:hypothetical protein
VHDRQHFAKGGVAHFRFLLLRSDHDCTSCPVLLRSDKQIEFCNPLFAFIAPLISSNAFGLCYPSLHDLLILNRLYSDGSPAVAN